MGLALLINSMALELSDVVAVSGFLEQVDASKILIIWVIDLIMVGIAASAQSFVVDRFQRIRVMQGMVIAFILAYIALRLMFLFEIMPSVVNYSLLFLLMEQQWLFFPLLFWVLANDIFDMAQSQRLFPLITAFGFVGQILGLGLASIAPLILNALHLNAAEPLTFNAINYVIILLIITFGLRKVRIRQRREVTEKMTINETLSEGFGFVREVKAFRYLMIILFATSLVLAVGDYHFLAFSDSIFEFEPPGSFQTFYGLFQLSITVIVIIVQALVTSRLIQKVHLKTIFTILPIVMLVCVGIIFIPSLTAIALGRAVYRIVQTSIEEPARKSLLSLVPDERRGRVSLFIDSYLFAAGAIIGCLVIILSLFLAPYLGLEFGYFIYLPVAAVASIIAIWAAFAMRESYDKSMLNWRLRRRSRGAKVLDGIEF
jgi:ATP:ADP antiporter, AAA family